MSIKRNPSKESSIRRLKCAVSFSISLTAAYVECTFTLHNYNLLRTILWHTLLFAEIVDKTADFVARKGPTLEDRIRENERHNPRFCFLNPNDPYHAYYQLRITQTKEGKSKIKSLDCTFVAMRLTVASATKAAAKPEEEEKEKEEETQKAPKEPSKFEFSADMPAMSAQDL